MKCVTWEDLVDEWVAHDKTHAPTDPPCDVCLRIDRQMGEAADRERER